MSKHDFPAEEFAARLARLRRAIADAKLDWLLVFHPVSMNWLIGTDAKSFQSFQCLLVAADAKPLVMLTRDAERNEMLQDSLVEDLRIWGGGEPDDPMAAFGRLVDSLGLRHRRVGMEVPAYYLHPRHYVRIKDMLGAALVAEPDNLVHDLKMEKSAREIALVREAGRIADLGMDACVRSIAEGRSELEIAGAVYHAMLSAGGGLPASAINLVTGDRLGFSHGSPTSRRLGRGEAGNVEFGAAYKRYTATIGRMFCLGKPVARMLELHEVVRRAGDACIAAMHPGVAATVPHEAAKRVIAEAGFDRYRCHTTAYGVAPGFPPYWGEPIHIFGGSRYTLRAGMVFSVVPPIFIGEERLGARITDTVLVTENGAERISRHSRDIIVVE